MAIYHKHFQQRSAEWFRLRAGIPTASCFHKIVTAGGKASKQSEGHLYCLLAEYILGEPLEDGFHSRWMERGEELESKAVEAYEFQSGNGTEECGLVTTDDQLIGASPDRLVIGSPGIVEIKVPAPQTHIASLLSQELPDDHKCQIQGQLWVCEREWCDIVSFHPKLPPVIIRVLRDEAYIEKLSAGVRTFVDVMLYRRAELDAKYGPFVRPKPKPEWGEEYHVSEADVDRIVREVMEH